MPIRTGKVINELNGPVGYDVMKTKSSYRTLPLLPFIEKEFLKKKDFQAEMKKAFRKGYKHRLRGLRMRGCHGKLYNPNFITEHFNTLLERNGMFVGRL